MLACIRYQKRLGAYMDGELSGRKQAAVERHLARCGECRAALNDLRGLDPLLHTLETSPAPADLTARIVARAYEQKRRSRAHPFRWWPGASGEPTGEPSGGWSWVFQGATAAALIVGLTMGAYMGWSSFPTSGSQPGLTASMAVSDDSTFYAFDAMSAAPDGSLEAAMLKLVEENR